MGLVSKGNSKTDNFTDSQDSQNTNTLGDGGFVSNVSAKANNGGVLNITDGGAIRGNVEIANQALVTADTITERIGEQSLNALDRVAKLATDFGGSVESIKKTELTGGTSLILDNLKYWPIIPIVFVLIALINKPSKGGK